MSVQSYTVPAKCAEYEFTEKHSRFIGHIFRVETAQQASDTLKALQKKYWDASHNVYAYILRDGTERFSDDGEPQGTSGMPTLTVLRASGAQDILCVTTRWFGGTLLGAGGLVRAYSQAAKGALDAAGLADMVPFAVFSVCCNYQLLPSLRRAAAASQMAEEACEYGEKVSITLVCELALAESAAARLTDLTFGKIVPERCGEKIIEKIRG